MSDPIRWRAPGGGAPSGARDLLRHASAPKALSAAHRAHHAAVLAKATAAVGAGTGAAAGTKLALGAKLFASGKLVVIGLASVAVVAVATATIRQPAVQPTAPVAQVHVAPREDAPVSPARVAEPVVPETSPPPAVEPVAAPVVEPVVAVTAPVARHTAPSVAAPSAIAAASGDPAPAPTAETTADPTPATGGGVVVAPTIATAAAPMPPEDPLAVEARLMERAWRSLASDPHDALAIVQQHEREFPNGQSAADRDWIAVQALRSLGRTAETRARAQALIAHHPRSPYVQRARDILDAP